MSADFAAEMLNLNLAEIESIDPPAGLAAEVGSAAGLKSGARKRQIKHLAGILRRDPELETRVLELLERRRGSAAKEKKIFHDLEFIRDRIVNDALAHRKEAEEEETRFNYREGDGVMAEIAARMPELDAAAVARAAESYCFSRKKGPLREIFRLLKSARESAEVAAKLKTEG